jgi:hypothetical protein
MEGHFTQTPCRHFERNREIFRQPSEGSVIAVSLRWPLSEMWGQTGRSLIVYRVDGRGFKRPSGTHFFFCLPGVETPGYFHLSIRDMRLGVGHPPIPEGLRIWKRSCPDLPQFSGERAFSQVLRAKLLSVGSLVPRPSQLPQRTRHPTSLTTEKRNHCQGWATRPENARVGHPRL